MEQMPNNGAQEPQKPADEGREPQFLSTTPGLRQFSLGALVERIISHFAEEFPADSTALAAADTTSKKLALVRDVTDYVLNVESVVVAREEKAAVIGRAYAEIFSYGPLDELLLDQRITTISLDGADKVAVRYGHGDLTALPPLFEDEGHMRRILRRLLADAGAELRADLPYLEVGLKAGERLVCINLVTPMLSFQYTADIRLHPLVPITLADLVVSRFMTTQALTMLRALMASPHGVIVAGDTESGKTTLLNALLNVLPQPQGTVVVERAGELRLPAVVHALRTKWPLGDAAGVSFGAQIQPALALKPVCLVLDEVRADEPESIAPLLTKPDMPRQVWVFRSSPDPKRLRSALGMLARRASPDDPEEAVSALYTRLPFVVTLCFNRAEGRLLLRSIAEWQTNAGTAEWVELLARDGDSLVVTGQRAQHSLDLPPDFWD